MDTLACNRAFGTTGSLLGGLIHQFTSWSFDDTVLVRFGGVAVTRPVYKTLHHFLGRSLGLYSETEIIYEGDDKAYNLDSFGPCESHNGPIHLYHYYVTNYRPK